MGTFPLCGLANSHSVIKALSRQGIPKTPMISALNAYNLAKKDHANIHGSTIILVNFQQPSTERRLYVINFKNKRLLSTALVAHGQGSGGATATLFSNKNHSHESSLGAFRIGKAYYGKHGLSLRLMGLQQGINSNAAKRHLVIHQAPYVSKHFIKEHGRLGRSWGCFALNPKHFKELAHYMAPGTFLYAYAPSLKNGLST